MDKIKSVWIQNVTHGDVGQKREGCRKTKE